MTTDPRVPTRDLEGKPIRLFFRDGEISEVKLVDVEIHENCHLCAGYGLLIYRLISSNRADRYKGLGAAESSLFSTDTELLDRFEVIPE